jgi:16S rRNA pseudouridine516 synthase
VTVGEPIDRFVARRRKWTWADARRAIHHDRIAINGVICRRYHRKLAPGDRVAVDGEPLLDALDDGVVLCHKAAGLACSHTPEDAPLLYDEIPSELRHPDLQSAGRLDRDTTGLIVLTIDGGLIQRLTDPEVALWKRYRIRFVGRLDADAESRVAAGLRLPDDALPCLSARLTIASVQVDSGSATLELCEGRHHQVKRMILALGGRVVALHRDRIGALDLPADLPPGAMRPATPSEIASACGG